MAMNASSRVISNGIEIRDKPVRTERRVIRRMELSDCSPAALRIAVITAIQKGSRKRALRLRACYAPDAEMVCIREVLVQLQARRRERGDEGVASRRVLNGTRTV